MASRRSPVDAELVLDAEQVGVLDVQEVSAATVGIPILLIDLEAHAGGVSVSLRMVIDGDHVALRGGAGRGHRLAEIMGEGCQSAEPGQVVA